MRVLKNHNHDNGDANSSGGPAYQPQAAAQDHEHHDNCSKVSKVNTQAGHDKRMRPKIVATGTEPGANASDAVKERETICTLNIIFHYQEYFVIFYLNAMLYLLYLQSFGLLDVTMTCCRLLQHTTEVLPLLQPPTPRVLLE